MLKKFRREGNPTLTEHWLAHYIHYLHLKLLKRDSSHFTDQKTEVYEVKITHPRP